MNIQPELPPWLAGLSIITNPGGGAGIADRSAGTLTRVMSCSGRGFGLRTDSEIDWLLGGWGESVRHPRHRRATGPDLVVVDQPPDTPSRPRPLG